MTDCASLPLRVLRESVSSRPENKSVIREMRLSVVRGVSIKRFHTGVSLREKLISRHKLGTRLEHTSCAKFLEHVDVGHLPGLHPHRGGTVAVGLEIRRHLVNQIRSLRGALLR